MKMPSEIFGGYFLKPQMKITFEVQEIEPSIGDCLQTVVCQPLTKIKCQT